MTEFKESLLEMYLNDYYKHLFPFELIHRWLTYGNEFKFDYREFALVLAGDAYLRYRSFTNLFEFQNDVRMIKPVKFDIGAVYNHRASDVKKYLDFRPIEREFVIDIDLTDYDDVRVCCSGTKMCEKCWRYLTLAIKILENILDGDLGFKYRLWVFSGRRGVHCWVIDKSVRDLGNANRSSIMDYLTVIKAGLPAVNILMKKMYTHPFFSNVFKIIIDSCEVDKLAAEQNWMSEKLLTRLLDVSIDYNAKALLKRIIEEILSLEEGERWEVFKGVVTSSDDSKSNDQNKAFIVAKSILQGFIIQCSYPRLDANVSKDIKHLLKCPFCVHPKTGLVSVPLPLDHLDEIEVNQLPRVDTLISEVAKGLQENSEISSCKQTSLSPYLKVLENFLNKLPEECLW